MTKNLLAAAFIFALLISACTEEKPEQVTLPAEKVLGFESRSFNLYTRSYRGAPTALGQIFSPPEKHTILTKVEFYGRRSRSDDTLSDMSVKLHISPWLEDRPGSPVLWESEPVEIQYSFKHGWLSFDVPHLYLEPGGRYIAWMSAIELQDTENTTIGIVSMGPRFSIHSDPGKNKWHNSYPEGARASWRHGKPESIEEMRQLPWEVDAPGRNLHFKMIFENRVDE
ncbi:MAG: hypothetical protein PVG39_19265 [Desulfobacteraceae bacterium]